MAKHQEMLRGIKFNRDRAEMYQEIADQGGDANWTREAAQAEADRFTGYADRIADSLAAQ